MLVFECKPRHYDGWKELGLATAYRRLVFLQVLEKRVSGGTAEISNAIKCHNVYDNGIHKCATPTVVNIIR